MREMRSSTGQMWEQEKDTPRFWTTLADGFNPGPLNKQETVMYIYIYKLCCLPSKASPQQRQTMLRFVVVVVVLVVVVNS